VLHLIKIKENKMDSIKTNIIFDDSLGEFEVELLVNGKKIDGLEYYTDDQEDAILTSSKMVEDYKRVMYGL